ncbi:MAG: hypothetical protein ACRDBO_20870 [Lachnospiraceae bacterium]
MMTYQPGCMARSLAGHDKDQYFIILREEGEYVDLADGKHRTVEKPKRKKKKHIQLIKEPFIRQNQMNDEEIRNCIKHYLRSHCGNQEVKKHVKSRCD